MTDNDTRYEYRVIRLHPGFVGGIGDDTHLVARVVRRLDALRAPPRHSA